MNQGIIPLACDLYGKNTNRKAAAAKNSRTVLLINWAIEVAAQKLTIDIEFIRAFSVYLRAMSKPEGRLSMSQQQLQS